MALNPNTIKALFGKLTPYADDIAKGVANYGDDAARLAANYGDDVATSVAKQSDNVAKSLIADNAGRAAMSADLLDDAFLDALEDIPRNATLTDAFDDLSFVGTRPNVRNRFPTSYDVSEVFDIGDNLVGYELSDVKIGDRWFRYPRQSSDYIEDIGPRSSRYSPRYSADKQRLRDFKRGLLHDFMDGTRRYDSPVSPGPSDISKALDTSPDALTYGYKTLLESNPHLKRLYSKLNPQYDWSDIPVDDLPF